MRHALIAAALLAATTSARAQVVPKDSTRRDTAAVSSDSMRYRCADCGYLALIAAAGYGAGLLASPSLFLTNRGAALPKKTTPLEPPTLAIYVTGGPVASQNEDLGWSHAEVIEAQADGFYGDLRYEQYWLLPQHVLYGTARVGYIAHPIASAYGGVVVGYREARGQQIEGRQQGVELRFPLFLGLGSGRWRFEPYYVGSRHGTNWNYRVQADWSVPGRGIVAGFKAETMSLPIRSTSRVAWVTLSAVIGVR